MMLPRSAAFIVPSMVLALMVLGAVVPKGSGGRLDRAGSRNAYDAGNFKDAFEGYRALAIDPRDDPKLVGQDLTFAVDSLQRLGRVDEIDAFREAVIKAHAENPRLARAAAESLLTVENFGFLVAGKFERGNKRGGGDFVRSVERDRVRALQVLTHVLKTAREMPDRSEAGRFMIMLANTLMAGRHDHEAWRLQALTDIASLPDYEPGWGSSGETRGAAVGADGTPVYYHLPRSFEAATSDGERWRWALAQAAEVHPLLVNETRMARASFLLGEFGVRTLADSGFTIGDDGADRPIETGPFAVQTLGDDETIARLATGVKRFKIPDEFNPIFLFRQVAESRGAEADNAFMSLAQIFEDRQQFNKAAKTWREALKLGGNQKSKQERLDQIIGRWGRFEPTLTQPGGRGAVLDYRFRNGDHVDFQAFEVLVPNLIHDIKAYLKTQKGPLDWQKTDLANIGYRLVEQNEAKYIGRKVATWGLDLKPRPNHVDDRVAVATPLQKAGAYLVTATMAGGNTTRVIAWVADTAIVKKPMAESTLYFVADAVSGRPIARANVEFFGYRVQYLKDNQFRTETRDLAEFTSPDGLAVLDKETGGYQWVAIARTNDGRFAFQGFSNVWHSGWRDSPYDQVKAFTITDRPVYRPRATIKFKVWVRRTRYDQGEASDFASTPFPVEIQNPKGEKLLEKTFQADAFGGFDGEVALPGDATLGVYAVRVKLPSGAEQIGTFRVEEYKKPEFEVSVDAPKEPVTLGETFKATIRAKYYFGAPVARAKVKYKVLRTSSTERWYPPGAWDWLYGPGYWWFGHDYTWYPGWSRWGCLSPIGFAGWRQQQMPEVVAEAEMALGADGTLAVEIDTAAAKAVHGETDHQYQVVAEVVDASRRTVVGQGDVLAAREPFKVFAWVDRGYYRAGDTIRAHLAVRTADRKPVRGKGTLRLLKVSYAPTGKATEAVAQTWDDVETDADGQALAQIKAAEAGQFRLSYTFHDDKGTSAEGGYVLNVIGPGFDGSGFRFNDVELVADKREYQPGEKVQLMVNADRPESTVLLFLRPSNGVYEAPRVIRLKGKSLLDEVEIFREDMPNLFVEAVTVANGKVHSDLKEIVVPPEKRVLNVEVTPSAERFKPGQKAKVKVKVTDSAGKPVAGSTVVAVYDKAVDYIAGGSNVAEIRAFFWKWRRSHQPNGESNLDRGSPTLARSGEIEMADLGVFGQMIFDGSSALPLGMGGGMGGFGGGGRKMKAGAAASRLAAGAKDAMPAPAAAPAGEMERAEQSAMVSHDVAPGVEPTVRTNFADTAFWAAALTTGADGLAEVSVDLPESLTTWKVKGWTMGQGTRVGQGEAEIVTAKDLLVRLQAPRFFVQKDEVVLSANIHNALGRKKAVNAVLEVDGACLKILGDPTQSVEVDSKGEARVDWRVKVVREGEAVVRMKAITDEESDAMEMRFPAYVHGMLKTESWAGAIRPDADSASITVRVPDDRRPEETRLEIRYSPSLAGALVDALPYLVDYPYGCTEQTLNRFLPTVVTQKVLRDLGVNLKDVQKTRTNLNAQEIGDPADRAKGWKQFPRNPVFDEAEVRTMVKAGLERLGEMQVGDGGWGWFSGWGEHSYPHTTALVVHGLQTAKENDVALVPGLLEKGVAWLKTYQDDQLQRLKNAATRTNPFKEKADNLDAYVDMVLVDAGVKNAEIRDFLFRDRNDLSVYAKAMLGLALRARGGEVEKLAVVLKNLDQYVVRDPENQTAYLKMPETNAWWHWYGNETEAQGYYLKLLARTDPKGETASQLVKYLINNRKHATYWESTRDTAICIEALAEYLKESGEAAPDLAVDVIVDGEPRKHVKITPADLFTFDGTLVLAGEAIGGGDHKVAFRKTGRGPLYFNAYLTNFTLEDPIGRAGLEVKVSRTAFKLVKEEKTAEAAGSRGEVLDQKVEKYRREPLAEGATLRSGDLVEVELEIDSKNDYEYLIFEDLKAAGFEPVDLRSGYNGNALGAYMELRDERVSFFVRSLARGRHSVAYRLRAEIPGSFSALPARASAMYAPELKGNSDEWKVKIVD